MLTKTVTQILKYNMYIFYKTTFCDILVYIRGILLTYVYGSVEAIVEKSRGNPTQRLYHCIIIGILDFSFSQ